MCIIYRMFVNISNSVRSSTPAAERSISKTRICNDTLDSGIFSPLANKMNKDPTLLSTGMLQISPLKMPLSPAKIKNESIMSEMTDISISEEWEKDFFSNFEENLFNMDIDDRMLSDILKSPKGKAAMNEMIRSPKGKAFVNKMMKSPKGKLMKRQFDNELPGLSNESPSSFDAKQLSTTPMKPELKGMLKMSNSKRRLTMTDPNLQGNMDTDAEIDLYIQQNILGKVKTENNQIQRRQRTEFVPIQPKENQEPVVWPSQERLKFARAQFQKTLQMAVQKVSQDPNKKKVKFQEPAKYRMDKYPEIKQALARPTAGPAKRQFPKIKPLTIEPKDLLVPFMESSENTSWYMYDDSDDDDEEWTEDVPFSSQKRSKNSRLQNKRRKY